jgi:hypothetical protein
MPVSQPNYALRRSLVLRGLEATCLIQAVLALGCTPLPARSTAPASTLVDATVGQSGKLLVGPHAFQDVYYTTPFAGQPKLDVPDHWGSCMVVIQTPTHFRVLNSSGSDAVVEWKASGAKAAPMATPVLGTPQIQPAALVQPPAPAVAAPPASLPQSPGAGLPAEPVPVTAPR